MHRVTWRDLRGAAARRGARYQYFVLLACAALLALGGQLHAQALKAYDTRGDEAPEARAYLNWVQQDLVDIEADMPAIAAAADRVADAFIKTKGLTVRGEPGLVLELCGRSGGFLAANKEVTRGQPVVYFMGVLRREDSQKPQASPDSSPAEAQRDEILQDTRRLVERQLSDCEKYRGDGSPVVAIVSVEELKSLGLLDRAKAACAAVVDDHAGAADGRAVSARDATLIPTFTVAEMATAWPWCCELFAACTRRGATPVMLKSIAVDTQRSWQKKYAGQAFHQDIHVQAIAPGVLGKAYVTGLREVLGDVGAASWGHLSRACDRMVGAINDGGKVYIFARAHCLQFHHAGQLAADPGLFPPINDDNDRLIGKPEFGDYALAVGYCYGPEESVGKTKFWLDPERIRDAGCGVCWVMSAFNVSPGDFHSGETVVDQQWAPGDALVKAPGYPIRIAPPSGVVAETIMWAMTAQVEEWVSEQRAAAKK